MYITLNGKEVQLLDSPTLSELLESHGLEDKQGIAVAVNLEVIPRHQWPDCKLSTEDSVLVIKATQGG